MLRNLERVVVIEDDVALSSALARILELTFQVSASEARTAVEAEALLASDPPPDLVVIDVRLPDGSAFGVLDAAAHLSPAPIIVAMSGKASPDEAFQLAQRGVRKFLQKPFSIEKFTDAIEAARRQVPGIEPMISAWVGRVPMLEMQREVRRVMVKEALARTEGSRSGAARLLQVTRQAVQQMVRSSETPALRRQEQSAAEVLAAKPPTREDGSPSHASRSPHPPKSPAS